MNDLFKKINTLVKATLNDALSGGSAGAERPAKPIKLGKGIEREVAGLRQRVNDALAYEDELQRRVDGLQADVERLDQEADGSVASGNDMAARYSLEQLQLAQQRLTMAQSDLQEHRLVTQELITRVNELEAAVADAQRAEAEGGQEATSSPDKIVIDPSKMLVDVLREMRERIAQLGDAVTARTEAESPQVEETVQEVVDDQKVEDDLAARRDRLSKK
ncbi:MAG: hypothetical protein JNM70_08965 [Anaerolineae bacterium]|nr:hypothetical protein [Anaerolineae bacterium]